MYRPIDISEDTVVFWGLKIINRIRLTVGYINRIQIGILIVVLIGILFLHDLSMLVSWFWSILWHLADVADVFIANSIAHKFCISLSCSLSSSICFSKCHLARLHGCFGRLQTLFFQASAICDVAAPGYLKVCRRFCSALLVRRSAATGGFF